MLEEYSAKIIKNTLKIMREKGMVKKGDVTIFTAGDAATNQFQGKTMTNMMNVVVVK